MITRRHCIAAATAAALGSNAQAAGRSVHVAWASVDPVNPQSPYLLALRSGLAELGWVEGRNLSLRLWGADGSTAGFAARVGAIVESRPDVIVGAGGPTTRVLVDANVPQPLAFTSSADVVVAKLVESWARPGVNRSGVSFFSLEIVPKRMELLTELLPKARRVAIVGWPPHGGELLELSSAREAADRLGLAHRYWGCGSRDELDGAFEQVLAWKADAIFAFTGLMTIAFPQRFAAFAERTRIPSVSGWAHFAENGNLMTYGPVLAECYRRLASIVDRMLRGVAPAEIPVERPTRFELVLHAKAARGIGIAVPRPLLLRADRVIEA